MLDSNDEEIRVADVYFTFGCSMPKRYDILWIKYKNNACQTTVIVKDSSVLTYSYLVRMIFY